MGKLKIIRLVYSTHAATLLKKLNPVIRSPLKKIIEELQEDPTLGKPLQDELLGFRSHRYRRYRVNYRYAENKRLVEILYAGPRGNVYQLFSSYLKEKKKL